MSQESPDPNAPVTLTSANLFEIAEEITSSTDLDTVLGKIGMVAKRLVNCEASSIMLLDDSKKHLFFKVATGEKGRAIQKMVIPVGVGIAGWVAQNLKPVVIEDTARDPRFAGQFDKSSGFITRSMICAPMFAKGEPLGVVQVLNKSDGKFGQEDLKLLTHLAGLASIAIANARLIQEQRNFFAHSLEVLVLAIESLGPKYIGRPWRAQRLCAYVGRRLELPAKDLQDLTQASLLHDIGFLAQRNTRYLEMLNLQPQLTPSENNGNSASLHAIVGEKILSGVEVFRNTLAVIRHHHERYDGTGYPDRLAGNAIPIGSRIIALSEMIEEVRQLNSSVGSDGLRAAVLDELKHQCRFRLDPMVVQACEEMLEEDELLSLL